MNTPFHTRNADSRRFDFSGVDSPTNVPTTILEAIGFIGEQQKNLSDAIARARGQFGPVLRPLPADNSPTTTAISTGGVAPTPRDPVSGVLDDLRGIIARNRDLEWAINRLIEAGVELQS